jgi:hypothetical protein
MEYSFQRYLAAKKTVDDRALNSKVWKALEIELEIMQLNRQISLLEVGAGIGTMVQRILESNAVRRARIKLIDAIPENMEYACRDLTRWADRSGWGTRHEEGELVLARDKSLMDISFEAADVLDFGRRKAELQTWDLVMANGFLDLFDLGIILPVLRRLSAPGGLAYYSINFDGVTEFEPILDRDLDDRILGAYHRSMDRRLIQGKVSGDSQVGRHLFGWLPQAGFEILEAGGSDWVVYSRDGVYPADEAYFLHHIIHFFEESLLNCPEVSAADLARWTAQRHSQIDRGELVYIAHQMDFLARVPKRG